MRALLIEIVCRGAYADAGAADADDMARVPTVRRVATPGGRRDQSLQVCVLERVHTRHARKGRGEGPFKCYVMFFSGNLTPTHPLVTLITLTRTSS